MPRSSHVAVERLRGYANALSTLTEDEHAHIARCLACQDSLGQCLAESKSEEDSSIQHG